MNKLRLHMAALLTLTSSAVFGSCQNPESLFESKECLRLELQKADRDVHKMYLAAQNAIVRNEEIVQNKNSALLALSHSQKAWLRYRETDCGLESVMAAGDNNSSQNEMQCKIDHAKARLQRLKEISE